MVTKKIAIFTFAGTDNKLQGESQNYFKKFRVYSECNLIKTFFPWVMT